VERSCECGYEPSGSINAGNYQVAAQLVASRVVLSSIELVSYAGPPEEIRHRTSRTFFIVSILLRDAILNFIVNATNNYKYKPMKCSYLHRLF
jgi:hypothetical protein